MADEKALAEVGTKLLFENERVRIWEFHLAPGEDSPAHRHDLDYVLVQIHGDRMAVVPEPGSGGPYPDYMEADVIPGQHFYIERGGLEKARNIGSQPYFEIIVELKD